MRRVDGLVDGVDVIRSVGSRVDIFEEQIEHIRVVRLVEILVALPSKQSRPGGVLQKREAREDLPET